MMQIISNTFFQLNTSMTENFLSRTIQKILGNVMKNPIVLIVTQMLNIEIKPMTPTSTNSIILNGENFPENQQARKLQTI